MYKQNIDVGCRKFEQCGQAVVLTRKLLSLVCLTAISPPPSALSMQIDILILWLVLI